MKKIASLYRAPGRFRTIFLVSGMTFLAKAAIVAKELVVAARYGRSDQLDAFLIAFLLPSFVGMLWGNAMNTAFIPAYLQCRETEGHGAASKLFAGVSLLNLALLGCVILLIGVCGRYLFLHLASGFSTEKVAFSGQLLLLLMPYVILSGVVAMWSALLNAEEYFILIVLSPVLSPLCMVLSLLIFPSGDIRILAFGTLAGILAEAIILGVIIKARGLSFMPGWYGWTPAMKQVIKQFIPATMSGILMGSSLLVDQAMAARLTSGSVTALSYGNKVIGFLLTMITTVLGVLLTPYFSKKMIREGRRELFHLFRQYLVRIFPLTFLLPAAITLISQPLVQWIYFRGAFTREDVKVVAGIQTWLAWQIPFYIGAVILSRLIAALQWNYIITVVAACNLVLNIGMNYWLMQVMGVNGIALSTALVHLCSFLLLLFFVYFSRSRLS